MSKSKKYNIQILVPFLALSILIFMSGCSAKNTDDIKGKFIFDSLNREKGPGGKIFIYENGKTRLFLINGYHPKWSPSGKIISYTTSSETNDNKEIFGIALVGEGGSKKDFITTERVVGVVGWSPNGDKICYVLGKMKGLDKAESLCVYNFLDKTHTKILEVGDNSHILKVEYSPTGKQIAFHIYDRKSIGWSGTWIVDDDGSNLRKITSLGGTDCPWYPDGKHIAYVTNIGENGKSLNNEGGAIFKINIDTGKTEMMRSCRNQFITDLKISKDGKYFYYTAPASGNGKAIFVSPIDNTNKIIQITKPVYVSGFIGYSQDEAPDWYQGN